MVGDAHPDDTAKGPSRERETKQGGFGEPAAAVNRPLLVQRQKAVNVMTLTARRYAPRATIAGALNEAPGSRSTTMTPAQTSTTSTHTIKKTTALNHQAMLYLFMWFLVKSIRARSIPRAPPATANRVNILPSMRPVSSSWL